MAGRRPRFLQRLLQHKHSSDKSVTRQDSVSEPGSSNELGEAQFESINLSANGGSPSLWTETYNSYLATTSSLELQAVAKRLRDESRHALPTIVRDKGSDSNLSNEWNLCKGVLDLAESKKSKIDKTADISLRSSLRHAFTEIITWTQKFIALGDVISQVDPIHIGLPWAAIRAILIVGLHSFSS